MPALTTEETLETSMETTVRPAPAAPARERRPASPQASLREAVVCLETANRRLKRGQAEQADEVLSLLRDATAHLHRALSR